MLAWISVYGARCRLAYGPADAAATPCLLLQTTRAASSVAMLFYFLTFQNIFLALLAVGAGERPHRVPYNQPLERASAMCTDSTNWALLLHLESRFTRLVIPFWCQLTRVVLEKGPLSGCVCVCCRPSGGSSHAMCVCVYIVEPCQTPTSFACRLCRGSTQLPTNVQV